MKICKVCGIQKSDIQFTKGKGTCKTCRNRTQRKLYYDNMILEGDDLLTNEEQYFKRSEQLLAQINAAEKKFEDDKQKEAEAAGWSFYDI